MSLREQIFGTVEERLKLQCVPVPEWGCDVYLRGWTGLERERVEAEYERPEKTALRERILVQVLLQADGSRVFEDGDVPKLQQKSGEVIERLFGKAVKISGVAKADTEEVVKN